MRVIINPQAKEFILHLYLPDMCNRNKESLIGRKTAKLSSIMAFFSYLKSIISNGNSTYICCVFAHCHSAFHMHGIQHSERTVQVNYALGLCFELFIIIFRPPVLYI